MLIDYITPEYCKGADFNQRIDDWGIEYKPATVQGNIKFILYKRDIFRRDWDIDFVGYHDGSVHMRVVNLQNWKTYHKTVPGTAPQMKLIQIGMQALPQIKVSLQ